MKRFIIRTFSFMLLLLAGIDPALAFRLDPISQVFAPSGQNATRSYQITNDNDSRIAVEVSVVERRMDIDGQETYLAADDDFLIYPSQIILEPGARQTVRVTWLGDPMPTQELAYRLVAEELPIRLVDPTAEVPTRAVGVVEIQMRYMGSLYVRPNDVESNVQITSITAQAGSAGEPQLVVVLDNQGTARAQLRNLNLHLSAQGSTVTLQADELGSLDNAVVLAGSQRRFVINRPATLPQGPVTATFDYSQP